MATDLVIPSVAQASSATRRDPAVNMPSSQEVVVRGAALPLTEAAYKKFDQGRIDLLQKTVPRAVRSL
jgi:hypothetical protein